MIRDKIAQNPNAPPEMLASLAKDAEGNADSYAHYFIAANRNTPPEILTLIAKNGREGDRARVARNPNTPR